VALVVLGKAAVLLIALQVARSGAEALAAEAEKPRQLVIVVVAAQFMLVVAVVLADQ
jgi:hypothetical protein